MEELLAIYHKYQQFNVELEKISEESLAKLRVTLWGKDALPVATGVVDSTELVQASPQQIKKRAKRLYSLKEQQHEVENKQTDDKLSPRKSSRNSKSKKSDTVAVLGENVLIAPVRQPSFTEDKVNNKKEQKEETPSKSLMPPPPPPASATTNLNDHSFARPQRAAKLKSEKNLKEPKLNQKMRRPDDLDKVKIKLEHEQRPSQMHEVSHLQKENTKSSLSSLKSDVSILVLPNQPQTVVEIPSDTETESATDDMCQQEKENIMPEDNLQKSRSLRVRIKREKNSLDGKESRKSQETVADESDMLPPKIPQPKKLTVKNENHSDESSMATSVLSATTTGTKKGRKKAVPKPIKVERFSDVGLHDSPISSRTRIGSMERNQKQIEEPQPAQRAGSIYEDAVTDVANNLNTVNEVTFTPPPTANAAGINETVTLSAGNAINQTVTLPGSAADATFCTAAQTTFQMAPGQTTFVMDNPNATITLSKNIDSPLNTVANLGDATFNVAITDKDKSKRSTTSTRHSMETAKDTSHPHDESLITEDESFDHQKVNAALVPKAPKAPSVAKIPQPTRAPLSAKAYKVPTRTNELFNPLVQSPVKKKVEAFEHAAQAATANNTKTGTLRSKRIKDVTTTTTSNTTPVIGKLTGPALGRFLTPTQASNITPSALGQIKKAPNSTSKAMAFPKSVASNLKSTNTNSTKTLSRENSAEDFRKGLHQLAEERKKQREQKHILAAQQREVKERERAERIAKLAKERDEKRIKKQWEAEQKKRDLEEIQRKLRQQEEAAAEAAALKQKTAKAKAIADQEHELLTQMKQQGAISKKKMMPPPNPKAAVKSTYTFEMLHEDDSTDEEDKVSYKRPPPPAWSKGSARAAAIRMQEHWPTDIIDNFFSVEPMTPDLKIIFPNISAHHLKRNSSVLWSTPPRYSELPKY